MLPLLLNWEFKKGKKRRLTQGEPIEEQVVEGNAKHGVFAAENIILEQNTKAEQSGMPC